MESSGVLRAIDEEIHRVLVSCSNTLIYNVTNNPAENYMNHFCKTSGGKRIDFAKAGSIGRRAKIAALAYQQPAQQWHKEVNKFVTGRSPTTPLRKFLSRRNNEHLKRIKRRQIFSKEKERRKQRKYSHVPKGGDKNYGDFPEKPDIAEEMYQILLSDHMNKLLVNNNDDLEIPTRGQASSERWREEKSFRLSSSYFKQVANRRSSTLFSNFKFHLLFRGQSFLSFKYSGTISHNFKWLVHKI
ncbi:hypothetical protein AVEN_149728-1 [Araneus ventricosus]|uniref:Uncharacterized protein n=1 Tax=Araneus ventricosus TaxID=182803 RepID=A0A4Y2VLX9_ARAVE|nr:hypothetical protein AVEN_149728-1 [Araneus ventricosus]